MSIKRSNAVWEHSKQSGNALILLLKLADNAADDGYCWPGIEHLAEKSRMSKRTVIRLTKKLETDGELFVVRNRRHGNKYIVRVGLSDEEFDAAVKKHFPFLTSDNLTYDTCVTSEVTQLCHIRSDTAMSQEPSMNRQENRHNTDAGASVESVEQPPPTLPPGDTLQFDTDKAKRLQQKLIDNAKAKGRRGPGRFPSLEMKRKFLTASDMLDGGFDAALTRAMEQGRTSITAAVNYLAVCAKNKQKKELPSVIKVGQ